MDTVYINVMFTSLYITNHKNHNPEIHKTSTPYSSKNKNATKTFNTLLNGQIKYNRQLLDVKVFFNLKYQEKYDFQGNSEKSKIER